MDLTSLYIDNKSFIENCAKKVARKYGCENILEDLISVGTIVFLERAESYNEQQGVGITTFLYRYISGAMRREAERSLSPFNLTKRKFRQIIKAKELALARGVSLDKEPEDGEISVSETISSPELSPEQQIDLQIRLKHLQSAFDTLSFKEREIVGGFFGVYDYKKQTLAVIGEVFNMKEDAALKAKDKALKKLCKICMNGELGRWMSTRKAILNAQQQSISKSISLSREPQPCYWNDILAGRINQLIKSVGAGSLSEESAQHNMRNLAIEAVAEQLSYKHPSLASDILNRLMQSGFDGLTSVEMIAAVSLEEVYYICKYGSHFNSKRYARKLWGLLLFWCYYDKIGL